MSATPDLSDGLKSMRTPKTRRLGFRRLALGAAALLLLGVMVRLAGGSELSPAELENPRCLNCHGQPHTGELTAQERRSMVDGAAPREQRPSESVYPVRDLR